ncbi:hypothetical protein GQR58_018383 [Nymphon striatum]|nr:hypothetical protein GQR58_018383 [Nymphon striatum]
MIKKIKWKNNEHFISQYQWNSTIDLSLVSVIKIIKISTLTCKKLEIYKVIFFRLRTFHCRLQKYLVFYESPNCACSESETVETFSRGLPKSRHGIHNEHIVLHLWVGTVRITSENVIDSNN